MEDFLVNATPNQLLLCLVGLIVGAIIFAGMLFPAFAARNDKKKQMKLGTQPSLTSPQAVTPAPPTTSLTSLISPPEFSDELDTRPLLSQALTSETATDISSPAAEPDLNLTILSYSAERGSDQKVETEDLTMGLTRQPREDKMGLAARINNRAQAITETAKSTSSQPVSNTPTPTPSIGQVNQPVGQPQVPAKPAAPVELLRLLRDPQSGQLIVEIAGRRYTKLADIADKHIGEYILKLAGHLLAFTNGVIATEAGIKALPVPKVGETPPPLAAPEPVSPSPDPLTVPSAPPPTPAPAPKLSPEAEAAFLASLAQPVKPFTPEPRPKRQGLFGRAKPAAKNEPLPELNLAEQINTIAQARLRISPLVATTKLEITSDPGGGILINVNGRFYSSPDDIPDPEVKVLIKDSIRQWEKS